MLAFILRRLGQAAIVMMAVALLAFIMFRFVGDPVNQMVGIETSLAEREALRERLGLNDPPVTQFLNFVWRALHFNFGISYQFKAPVSELLASRLPATLELSLVSALVALLAGVPMGVYSGLRRDSWLSRLFLTVSLLGVALPTFLIGILLIYLFSVLLGWLPSFGRGQTVDLGFWTTGLQLGSVIAFAIITETVFQWPGMGLLFLQAVQNVDIPIMSAYLLLIAFLFVVINLTVDLLYFAVDPRLRISSAAGH